MAKKYRVARPIDPRPYLGTSAVPKVGDRGEADLECDPPPAGKTAVRFFAGDLGYGVDGTKTEPGPDDFLTLYVPTECLEEESA
jgi:hypothetical protein